MIGKRDQLSKDNKNKNQEESESESVSEEEDQIMFSSKQKDLENENITFEFFPANLHFSENINYLLQRSGNYWKTDLSSLVFKILDQTEMGIFVGTEDDIKAPKDNNLDLDPKSKPAFPNFYNSSLNQQGPSSNSQYNESMLKHRSVYAFLTIINLDCLKNSKIKESSRNLLLSTCKDKSEEVNEISKLFDESTMGILISERVINFPFCVVPDLYEQLYEDRKFIDSTDELTVEDKKEWDFDYLIYFCLIGPKVRFIRKALNLK
jgi:hypothetical protein